MNLTKLNHDSIILIPKNKEGNTINQYRPINLMNCSVKIIIKILANRLASVLDTLIDESQTAFIKGRNI
jgi:Reverse transcriptase (RNA-dependent DNA polymerase)